jgi:class 3 adenylate cyclase/tetratricopeptide (TPR) repeat protein
MSAGPPCPVCGSQSEAGARFCQSCGAGLSGPSASDGETRKVVTVLFCDVTDSTVLGEALDPEALRQMMSGFFGEMRTLVERHGGRVAKFIGDAVMGVFGIPQLHEDDALRAVRAAVEMRDALPRLNEQMARTWGVRIAVRTGVNTGEVIARDPARGESLLIGDATNLAARLEQTATPGEVLIGDATYRLVREAVVAEPVAPLTLKGKSAPVAAWRVIDVVAGAPGWARRLDSPLVGRTRELSTLHESFERTVAAGSLELVTVMGPAGIGKSRLTGDFLESVGDRATVISGRCLPYGEGTTFWPVVAALKDAARVGERDSPEEARHKISALQPEGEDAALISERIAALLGFAPATPRIQETFWAVRKLFEGLAAERPLVVVFDDIHWAESTFLDLLEYLAEWIRQAPALLVCLARPELLEERPSWMAGKPNATLASLQPLTESEMAGLIQNLVGEAEELGQAVAPIAAVAEGNPLFAEETLRMLVDDDILQPSEEGWVMSGDVASIAIPPTIHALITARLDRLDPEERAVIERASVVGRVFWWSAVSELSAPQAREEVTGHLHSLMRKELIRPEHAEAGQEDAFRFAHILVRDAAYNAMPKTTRAALHERLADWIDAEARHRAGEYEEILAFHLEQARRLLLELGPSDERSEALGRRAAALQRSAGARAFARGDMPAAVKLLSRAAELLPESEPERVDLLPQLAFALFETGDFAALEHVVADVSAAAASRDDPGLEAHTTIAGLWVRLSTNPEGWFDDAEREAAKAIATFRAIGDERGLAKGWALLGLVHSAKAHFALAERAWEQAAGHARRAGDRREELESLSWVPLVVWAGPMHVDQGLERCAEVLERVQGDKKAMSSALMAQAAFQANLGRFAEARDLIDTARALLQEVALTLWLAGPLAQLAGWVELLADDPAAAERELRWGGQALTAIGELSWLSTVEAILAEAVHAQGRDDEALCLTQASEERAGAEDAYSQGLLRSVRAKVLAHRGDAEGAERVSAEAMDVADTTDFLLLRWHARMSRALVLDRMVGERDPKPVLREALELAEQKGSIVGARSARALIEPGRTHRVL